MKKERAVPRILLCAPASGSGKTLITCGILQALVNRGKKVASFKCGPDYIDPMFHGRVIGTKSRNLDTFFTDSNTTRYLFAENTADCDLAVVEGVMGYYDGLGGVSTDGSTYDVARTLSMPSVLIVNSRGASLSVLATIKGFLSFREDSQIRAVILNQVSPMIYAQLKPLIEQELGVQVLGYVPKLTDLNLESRHLGLVLPGEIEALKEKLKRLASALEETLDLDALLRLAETTEPINYEEPKLPVLEHSVKIAVAADDAFCFTYLDNLSLLEKMGAKLVFFSPLKDTEAQLLGDKGMTIRGHEFHYWESEQCGESFHAKKPVGKRQWDCVNGNETLYAGFPHLFFWSAPEAAYTFLKKCEEYGTC